MSKLTKGNITRSNIISHSGAIITDSADNSGFAIFPQFKGGLSNSIVRSGSGDYDGGDRVIGFPNGYEVDGDLLFTVGWGDGFAVRRLNNDGSMTRIFQDSNFLWRDTGSTYNHLQSVAIDTTNKLGVVMTYNVDGYTTFDYSGCTNGGTTFVKDARPTHSDPDMFIGSQDTSNGYIRRSGLYYTSGMVAAGEWIYVGEYSGTHYRRACRRNLNTGVEEIIGNSSGTGDLHSGSATIDRNGYRYTVCYDEVNDRVFYFSYSGAASFIVVLDASTSSPELLWCDMGDAGQGTASYDMGMHIPDPTNAPNRMWIGHNNRFNDIDITPCFSGSAPTIHANIPSITYFISNPLNRLGTKYQKTSGVPMDKIPSYPNFVPLNADRGRCDVGGWIDTDNNIPVAIDNYSSVTEDTDNGRGGSPYFDYSCPAVLMQSANGTKYWVKMGYGGHGHSFHVWAENTKPYELKGSWEVVFGTYTLANSANIDHVSLPQGISFGIPSSTTLTIYVSNNNGSTWETYDKDSTDTHVFSTSGTQLRVKFSANGQPDKVPYYSGNGGDGPIKIFYGSLHAAAKDSSIKFKINRKRLRH